MYRVIAKNSKKQIGTFEFQHYGAHIDNYPHNYLTVAAAIGMKREEVIIFMQRLRETLKKLQKKTK